MRLTLDHLPRHLQEVCAILAAGLVRLRRHTGTELTQDAANLGAERGSSLHFCINQNRDEPPSVRGAA
jgi:hypothetical protein